jgi:hypothetical protein
MALNQQAHNLDSPFCHCRRLRPRSLAPLPVRTHAPPVPVRGDAPSTAAMSEMIQQAIEGMVPELEEYIRASLFTKVRSCPTADSLCAANMTRAPPFISAALLCAATLTLSCFVQPRKSPCRRRCARLCASARSLSTPCGVAHRRSPTFCATRNTK